jgi:GNAT superfamily N-acetyltransferase
MLQIRPPPKYRTVSEPADNGCGLATIDVSPIGDDLYYVNRVFVPQKMRGHGVATRLFTRLTEDADKDSITLYIDPTTNYGSDIKRLTALFARFGFVKGDYEHGSMCRRPR